uniref:Uncharacterized protein n=1 Tax=viral metagenome TaxID=1070528 RepID=A0A6M3MEJ0_9ZZZZ
MLLTVTGNLEGLQVRLERIQRIIQHRKTVGYPFFHSSERWKYFTRPDLGEVCPVCAQYDQQVFTGDQVKAFFPYVEAWPEFYEAFPHTHMPDLSQFMGEPCHCELKLLNPVEAFEAQLHREKMEAI